MAWVDVIHCHRNSRGIGDFWVRTYVGPTQVCFWIGLRVWSWIRSRWLSLSGALENGMMLSWDCHEQTGWNSCEKLSCSSSNGTVPPPFFFLETQPLLIHKTERGLYQKLSDTILIKASQQKCFFSSKNYVSMFVFIFAVMVILVIRTMTKMMLCVDVSIRDPISRR